MREQGSEACDDESVVRRGAGLVLLFSTLAACSQAERSSTPTAQAAASSAPAAAGAPPARAGAAHTSLQGGALALAAAGDALWLADEDRGLLRRVALPLAQPPGVRDLALPGAPAQVVAFDDRVLVTVRDPGMLVVLRVAPGGELVEAARIALPADAWGLAVTADRATAIVTSAWTHRVSAIDLATASVRWSADVAREPRGIAVREGDDGAYVTHLVGASITRVDGLRGDAPRVSRVRLDAAPLRGNALPDAATLAYGAALSPDGARLFVPRQALGARGKRAWNGQSTVDVMLAADDTPLAAPVAGVARFAPAQDNVLHSLNDSTLTGAGPVQRFQPFVQPRAVVYRRATRTLLVASEGTDALVELDALSIDPSAHALASYDLGGTWRESRFGPSRERDVAAPGASRCGAPTGVALSADERTGYVFCRSTGDVASVPLDTFDGAPHGTSGPIRVVHVADDPLPEPAATGRRLFYDAVDSLVSGQFACAGCHPEGRDDGHVWQEAPNESEPGKEEDLPGSYLAAPTPVVPGVLRGRARQTPMLAGRVAAGGPYGWRGKSPNLPSRIIAGFRIHRWIGDEGVSGPTSARAVPLAAFLREGLRPPPRPLGAPTPEEALGRTLFMDALVGCASCHVPQSGYTDGSVVPLAPWPARRNAADFEPDLPGGFKTPSLLFVGGTPPYFHDGAAATLEALVEKNGDRMGRTSHLSPAERAALVAFLKTL
jgi:cytochrome c peroxidase